jgi:small subunit ribosomal protein S5
MPKESKVKRNNHQGEVKEDLEQKLVDLARVTRVTRGGKRLGFRACVVVGDKKEKVGYGVAKGSDVAIAINKAVAQAKKRMIKTKIVDGSVPHQVKEKFKAAIIMIRPGKRGRGIIAGGVVRTVLELGGYRDAVAKIIGSKNKINNVKATYSALKKFK